MQHALAAHGGYGQQALTAQESSAQHALASHGGYGQQVLTYCT